MGNCNFSQKFLPLVQSKYEEFISDPEGFRAFLDQNFNPKDAESVFRQFYPLVESGEVAVIAETGVEQDFETEVEDDPVEIEEYHTKQTFVTTTSDSVDELFIGRPQDKVEMLQDFRREILSASRLKINWSDANGRIESVDANAKSSKNNSINNLNQNIFEYKVRLINTILRETGKNPIAADSTISDEEFAKILNDVLQTNVELSAEAYSAYVVLSRFDDLLESEAPYVKVKREYQNSDGVVEGIDKYEYMGATVQHFTGWTSSEFADSMDQASLLAKTVLECIPEVVNGVAVPRSSVGLSGFFSCMSSMRDCLMYHPTNEMIEIREELKKGDSANMYKLIDAYINYLKKYEEKSMSQYYKPHVSYLLGKLEGIKEYLFKSDILDDYSSSIDPNLKSIFKQMFFKNVQMSYSGYTVDPKSGELEGKDLKGSFINAQTYGALDNMAASIYKFRTIPKSWEAITRDWDIKRIAHGTFSLKGNTRLAYNGNSSDLSDFELFELFQAVTGIVLPTDFVDVYKQVEGNDYRKVMLDAINVVVGLVENGTVADKQETTKNFPSELRVDHFKTLAPIGKVLSIVFGSNVANVVKNVTRKNNLPLFGLNSLAYNFPYIMWQHLSDNSSDNIYKDSFLYEQIGTKGNKKVFEQECLVLEPSVRSEVYYNGNLKSVDALTVSEVLRLAIMSDFYKKVTDDTAESVAFQNATFADKATHFLINYRLDSKLVKNGKTIREMIKESMNGNSNAMVDLMYSTRSRRFKKLQRNICRDYNTAFNKNFKTLAEIQEFIKTSGLKGKDIIARFNATPGIDFYEEIHLGKNGQFNETLLQTEIDLSSKENFNKRLSREKKLFVKDLAKNGFQLNKYTDDTVKAIAEQYPGWEFDNGNLVLAKIGSKSFSGLRQDADTITSIEENITLHPVLEAYFMSDVLLSNEYNDVMIGGSYCHPGKSESSRLIAQIKRSVIFGATQHSFAQNLPNGVAEDIKIAVMPDMPGSVRNIIGEADDSFKSMDGAGLCTALQARLESNSLLDARAGYDKKTIGHDIDSRYGRPTLLKWAVYAMTNDRRRISYKSRASQEGLTKQCYSAEKISVSVDWLNDALALQDVYYFDSEDTGAHYKILRFEQLPDGTINRVVAICDESGELKTGQEIPQNIGKIDTLYGIDQAFGGAWCMSNNNGKLEYSETNVDALEKFVTENQSAKNAQVAYLVNKSAIKVGAGNINDLSAWDGKSSLRTISMKTRYLGVQMDAEHHLDESEVTEMTQMISALSQAGYTSKLVNAIYEDIGRVVDESLAEYKTAEQEGNEAIYQILGKAFIESFEQNDRDTIGLAQAFVLKAAQALKEGGHSDYRIPFSADTVNGLFISTISSAISKKGIRRKYDGFAGVLSPSFNQIQYYRIGNEVYLYEEFAKEVHRRGITSYIKADTLSGPQKITAIDRAMNDYRIDGELNPFLKPIYQNQIDYEDTIVIMYPDGKTEEIYVKTDEQYDRLKHCTFEEGTEFYNFTSKPKNLKDVDTKFEVGLKTHSVRDLDSVRAAQYLNREIPELVVTGSAATTAQVAKEIGGIDTLRHPWNGMHFGNPFSFTQYAGVQVVVPTVKDSVIAYEQWLRGEAYQDVEPERRKWIVNQIKNGSLKGKTLVYYTNSVPDNSYGRSTYDYETAPNHAHILQKLIYEDEQKIVDSIIQGEEWDITSLDPETDTYTITGSSLDNYAKRNVLSTSALTGEPMMFSTVEGAYQAAKLKYTDLDAATIARIEQSLVNASGQDAHEIGQKIPGLNVQEWDKNSTDIMRTLIEDSFNRNPSHLKLLLQTGDVPLVVNHESGKWNSDLPVILSEIRSKLQTGKEAAIETYQALFGDLGGDEIAENEIRETMEVAKRGISFEEALSYVNPIFTPEEQAQIKEASGGKLFVKSVSRHTDPVFFSKEIVKFLKENAKLPFTDPRRVNAIEIWSKHDGQPIADILEACRKYKVAPMVSFSVTGLGGTALEQGVMKYQDMMKKIGELVAKKYIDPRTTTIRIDPILVGETNPEDIKSIVQMGRNLGIRKYVTSLVQSYGYLDGTSSDRKVTTGINNALAKEGRTYDWDKYYGIVTQEDVNISNAFVKQYRQYHPELTSKNPSDQWKEIVSAGMKSGIRVVTSKNIGKIHFVPKPEYINEIGNVLRELDQDPDVSIQTCSFHIDGLKVSACLDPMIIERVTGIDVTSADGTYDRDTSRPECMCYGTHGDMFKVDEKTCNSSCAYCYAAHSGDTAMKYYDENGNLLKNTFTTISSRVVDLPRTSDSGIVYNEEQRAAIKGVSEIISSAINGNSGPKFVTIQGKAGTGKTTIINEILNEVAKTARFGLPTIEVTALSHKAKSVLENKIDKRFDFKAHSLAGALGFTVKQKSENGHRWEEWVRKTYRDKPTKAPVDSAGIIFVDEASMVTEEHLQYIQSAVKGRNVAVVFIGDVGQINPIRKPKSGVPLDAESPIFTNPGDIPVFELTERIRQGEDSPVLAFADMYYDFNTKKTQIVPDSRSVTSSTNGRLIIGNMSEINFVDQLKELFFEAKETLNPNKIKIVAGTNLTVDKYNRMIQKLTNPQVTDDSLIRFGVGDMIMFNSNIYNSDGQTIVENADEGQIVSVDPTIHTDPETNIKYYTVVAKTLYNDIELLIPINTQENNNTYIEVYNSLHDAAASNEFDQELLNDFKRKFGAKIDKGVVRPVIGLGYAITSDKSQGSTYEVVAVDVDDISKVTLWSETSKAKRIYTALTRGSNITVVKDSDNTNTESRNVKEINDNVNASKAAPIVENFVESELDTNLVGYINHSGGADGSDSVWGEVGEKYGVVSRHYYHGEKTPKGNVEITESQYQEGVQMVMRANKTLRRKPEKYMDLLARNWMQVKGSDSIFAVGKIVKNIVDGGTGWAVQMAIDEGKPVYVFNQEVSGKFQVGWYKYDYDTNSFVPTTTPVLTTNFAGIGTREINNLGVAAIEEVYKNTLRPRKQKASLTKILRPGYIKKSLTKEQKAKIIRTRIQEDLRNLANGKPVMMNGKLVQTTGVRVIPAEGISGKYHAKEFGFASKDTVAKIKKQGPKYFERKLRAKYQLSENGFKRLQESLPEQLANSCESLLFTKTGEKFLVAQMSVKDRDLLLANDPNLIIDKSFKKDGDWYYKGSQRVTKAENATFCTYKDVDGNLRKMIILTGKRETSTLLRSTFFDVNRKIAKTDGTWTLEKSTFNDWVKLRAKRMFDSFEEQLQTIGTRIPTQAMPSFMPMEIIAYTDSKINDLYVPISLLQRQGADLDIDKEYMLGLGIGANGLVYLHTKLDGERYKLSDLYRLDMPTGIEYRKSESFDPNAVTITASDLKNQNWIDLINKCMRGNGFINFVGFNNDLEFAEFLMDLNTHALTELTEKDKQEAVKNKVSMSIKQVTKSVVNQVIAQISVDTAMKGLGDIAKQSTLANDEKTMTSDNPATKFVMQVQNMVGRQVIGVTAVSLKQFFAKTAYWNGYINDFSETLRQSTNKRSAIEDFVESLMKSNPLKDGKYPLANLNFLDLIDEVKQSDELNVKFGLPTYTMYDSEFNGIPLWYGSIAERDGRKVGARMHPSGRMIQVDLVALKEKWDTKAWKNSLRSDNIDFDFQSFEEFVTFCLYHETAHSVFGHVRNSKIDRRQLENDANKFAMERIMQIRKGNSDPMMYFNGRYVKDFAELLQEMQSLADTVDSAMLISALLSAATDNAKELILSKLNATTNLADIYTYLFSLGSSAEEVGAIMTSKEFSFIAKIADGDLFGIRNMPISNAINLYLGDSLIYSIDPNLYNKAFGTYSSTVDVYNSRKQTLEKLQSIGEIDAAIQRVIAEMNKSQRSTYDPYGEYGDIGMYVDDFGFESDRPVQVRDFAKQKVYRREWEQLLQALFVHRDILIARATFGNEMDDKLRMILTKVLPGVEEQKILGAAAGINTGLKTKSFDKFRWARRIENYVNRMFPYNENDPATSGNREPFRFSAFLSDEAYQKMWIDKMETMKISDNILKVITSVPHYKAMLDAWRLDKNLLSKVDCRFVLEEKMAEKIQPSRTHNFSDQEWREIQKFVNDVFIYNWIVSGGFKFRVPDDFQTYTATQKLEIPASKIVSMDSPEGIATFKRYVEMHVIPTLKEKKEYQKNGFIQALDLTAYEDRDGIKSFYKLPLPMMDLDKSPALEERYSAYLMAFNGIVQDEFEGWKIGDIFYMYNLIVHKDSFGQRSMTRLFEDMASSSRSSLVNSFNEWLSKQDADPENTVVSYDPEDLKYRISKSVPNSKITSKLDCKNESDFTFVFPSVTKVKELVEPETKEKTELVASKSSKVTALFEELKSTPGTILMTESDYDSDEALSAILKANDIEPEGLVKIREIVKSKKAFTYNGKVFLNVWQSSVSDQLHEFAHVLLATMKWSPFEEDRNKYYELVSSVVNDPNFNQIAKAYRIDGQDILHGSDLQEEVFVNMFQMYLENKIFNDDTMLEKLLSAVTSINNSSDQWAKFKKVIESIIEGTSSNKTFVDLLSNAIILTEKTDGTYYTMSEYGSRFGQKIAAFRTKLVNDNKLNIKCD